MLSQIPILAVLAACAVAQNNFTVDEFFNLTTVSLSTRSAWCDSQSTVCNTLCGGSGSTDATNQNNCSNVDLSFTCLCTGNNSEPGLQFYQNTILTNKCVSATGSCILAHPMDKAGQTECDTDINATCGTIDSSTLTFNSTPISTSTSASTSATAVPSNTGSSTSASASATSTSNAAAAIVIDAGQQYSLGALAAGAIAAFGFML